MKTTMFAASVLMVALTACASAQHASPQMGHHTGSENVPSDQQIFPATPLEFAQRYAAFTETLDAAGVNTLVSEQMTLVWPGGASQKTFTRAQQLATLTEIYKTERAAGKKLRAADYVITQHSSDFAIIKFTWEVDDPAKDRLTFARTSYVIRKETEGWRLVFVMELGPGFGTGQNAEFS